MPTQTPKEQVPPLALLLAHAGGLVQEELRKTFGASGLRPRHGQVMMHLFEHGPTSQQDLLDQLGADPSVLVGLLNDLEGQGLVARVRDPADRRRHIVELSDRGRTDVTRIQRTVDAVETRLFAGVSATDRKALRRALHSVCHASLEDQDCD